VSAPCAALSDPGLKRRLNEDCCAVDAARGLYVVADGLGAHAAGRQASQTGVAALLRCAVPEAAETPLAMLRRAVRQANREIHAQAIADARLRGMGTTLAALWLCAGQAHWAHVGDSRIYLLRGGRLIALTLDHSLATDRAARRAAAGRAGMPGDPRHVVTRALGVQPEVEPDTARLCTRPGDLFALLTDGISAVLSPEELADILGASRSDLTAAANGLVAASHRRGGEDNATVVLVRVDA
jgi:protein phosphatase